MKKMGYHVEKADNISFDFNVIMRESEQTIHELMAAIFTAHALQTFENTYNKNKQP
jgi:hypothetical protein